MHGNATDFPQISIVIPCYNGARFLRETLDSVRRQTYPATEVIVIDDGSTDDSAAIAESFGSPVRVLRQTNHGESVARNRGISVAAGDWIALLDADDLWEPRKLERQVDVVRNVSSGWVCVYTHHYFHRGAKTPAESRPEYDTYPDARIRLLFDWCIIPSSAIIRRDVATQVPFVESVRLGEDMIFFSQLRQHGDFVKVPEPLTGYRVSASQQTKGRNFHIAKMRCLYAWFTENAARYSPSECAYFYDRMKHEVSEAHDQAYWERRLDVVRECRKAFAEMFADQAAPPLFRRPLLPTSIYFVRDWIGRIGAKCRSS
jgi:glycosyltransferase involved in cell wall biosynthesis